MAIESAPQYIFNPNEIYTLAIAAYAAVVSTFVFGWDAYKWLASGPKINLTATPNMLLVGGVTPDNNKYISTTAYNVGDQPTTIVNLGGMYFDSWWSAYITKRNPVEAFIITQPSQSQKIPYRFEVGDQWIGLTIQNDDLTKKAKEGYLFIILYTTQKSRGHRVRVKIKEKQKQ